jgi:hypothetical protein
MGNKKRKRSTSRVAKSKQNKAGGIKKPRYTLLALAVGAILIIGGIYFLPQGKKDSNPYPESGKAEKEKIRLRETRPTLPPERFKGKVMRAYTVARQIPEVLDQLYCYCRCRENFGHKNLLTCFVDNHAAT